MTLGKLANIASEVGDLDKAAEGTLKAFTAGDRMYFDRKGLPGIEAYPTARLVLATNNRPRFTDRSGGLWRRMMVLQFPVSIPEERQDPHLAHSLRAELPGIFIWAMLGLDQLRRRRRFTVPQSCADALADYQLESNPARMFLDEHVEAEPGGEVACETLYWSYAKWCEDNHYRPLGERMFGKEVFRRFPLVKKTRPGPRDQRVMHYSGLAVSSASSVSHVPLSHER
jgi:putative DNA primase/helicase